MITTVAGCGRAGSGGDGGPALGCELSQPHEIRFDSQGDLFIVERDSHRVRKVALATGSGAVSTVAGTGEAGFSGDGGPATQAQLNQPHSIQFSPVDGDLFICDIANHRLRRVSASTGIITTFAGTGSSEATPEGGCISEVPLCGPRAIDFDSEGDMFLALREGNRVLKLLVGAGTVHSVAGTGETGPTGDGGPALLAKLTGPKGIALLNNSDNAAIRGREAMLLVVDTESHSIRQLGLQSGIIETLLTGLARPHGIFADCQGQILVGDSENHVVLQLRPVHGSN